MTTPSRSNNVPPKNFQPRGLSQTVLVGGPLPAFGSLTSGDVALRTQQNTYELLSQQFVGSIEAIQHGEDITIQAQNALLALVPQNQMSVAQAQTYQPTITPSLWAPGIIDWFAVYTAQVALARNQGWN